MVAKQLINDNLKQVLSSLNVSEIEPNVQIPEKNINGDYFTNLPLKLSSEISKKPLDIAYMIKSELEKSKELSSVISKIEVAPPGFINFFLSEQALLDTVSTINKEGNFGNTDTLKGQKIMIEFTDPNPFKEFHIGHLYVITVGESLCRLFELQGAEVRRVCYQGDVGLHVAKAIYGMQKLISEMPDDEAPLNLRAQFLGKAYANGATKYEENENIKEEINVINKKVYDATDEDINTLYEKGRTWSLEYFDTIYERVGTKFENFYFESEMTPIGVAMVREYLKKNVFEESDGAIIFPGKKYGLHNRVFINSIGLPTYEAKDMGLFSVKYKDFKYDRSIIITGKEQSEYFKVVNKAMEQIEPELAHKTTHISNGLVRLPTGKMSSRTGDVITGEWLMDEAISRIQKEFPEMDEETSEKVGLAAIKFAFLKSTIGEDTTFSFDESISLSGASGPYVQYTYVRTQSVIKKYKDVLNDRNKTDAENELNPEEKDVIRQLIYFPEILSTASEKLSPNLLAEYLFNLSQKFNLFYQKHKIADSSFRLELTSAVGEVLKNGLHILGIETVKAM